MDRLEGLEKQLQNERENLRDLLGRFEKKQWDYRAKGSPLHTFCGALAEVFNSARSPKRSR